MEHLDNGATIKLHEDHPVLWVLGDMYTFLATGEETDGAYALWHAVISPGDGMPLHAHASVTKRLDILRGHLDVQIGENLFEASPGDSIEIPPGVPHSFRCGEDEDAAEVLMHVQPAGFEGLFFEIGTPVGPDDEGPPPVTDEEMEAVAANAERFGFKIVGPPLS